MQDRPYLKALILWALTVASAFLAARYGIVIPPPPPPAEPIQPAPPTVPPEPQPDVKAAIGRIQFGRFGCTATPIGKRRSDGRYTVVTAAHCVSAVGEKGRFTSQKGETLTVTAVARDPVSDCCWLLTDATTLNLPFAELADAVPASGTPIWHAGYGVDRPGNRENGTFVSGPDSNGQVKMRLSVSSGDSGGAIVIDSTGRVVSVVCCTTGTGQLADVWGAGPSAMTALRRTLQSDDWWIPIDIPIVGKKD